MKEIYFKKLNHEDLNEDVFEKIYSVERNSNYEPYSKQQMQSLVFDEKLDTFLCAIGEDVVGVATFNANTKKYPNSIYMINLTILPQFQGQGLAKRLMLCAFRFYEKNEREWISNEVDRTNEKALGLYKKLGFTEVEELCDDESLFLIVKKDEFGKRLQEIIGAKEKN